MQVINRKCRVSQTACLLQLYLHEIMPCVKVSRALPMLLMSSAGVDEGFQGQLIGCDGRNVVCWTNSHNVPAYEAHTHAL